MYSLKLGLKDGDTLGLTDGLGEGLKLGDALGLKLGDSDGEIEGLRLDKIIAKCQ